MMLVMIYLLLFFLIATAIYAVSTHNLLNSIVALSIFSANLVVIFAILQAPDVALVEAVVATGITTAFFVITLNKLEGIE